MTKKLGADESGEESPLSLQPSMVPAAIRSSDPRKGFNSVGEVKIESIDTTTSFFVAPFISITPLKNGIRQIPSQSVLTTTKPTLLLNRPDRISLNAKQNLRKYVDS